MSSRLRIAVSGKSGCGNTVTSRILADALGFHFINYTFRNLSEELGIPFDELGRLAETDSRYDHHVDKKQLELASHGNCVLGSRLAIWLLKDADLKVYLHASPEVRADRIAKREGWDFEATLDTTTARDRRDRERYRKLYDIDVDDFAFVDLVVDTELGDPNFVSQTILEYMSAHGLRADD